MSMKAVILFEDDSLLAVVKPAGVKVHGGEGETTLETMVAEALGRRAILLHRLDRETTGVVLFAKRKDAAGELSRAFEEKRIRKSYWAVVQGKWPRRLSRVDSWLGRDPLDPRRQKSCASSTPDARPALTTFRVLAEADENTGEKIGEKTWLEAIPKTGRTHQIRVHCASQGHAILGDQLYGTGGGDGLALHARRLLLRHPLTGQELDLVAPPPENWERVWLQGFARSGERSS